MQKNNIKWIHCPVCGSKTRNQIRADTVEISHYIVRNANRKSWLM